MCDIERESTCSGPHMSKSDFYLYMNEQAKPKKEKPLEGDGRRSDKNDHKGDWGKHEPVRDRPQDRDKKSIKPWKKK